MSINKMKKSTKIIITVLLVVLICIICVVGYIYSKLNNIKIEEIDKNDLGVNEQIYEDVSENTSEAVTEEEFSEIKTFVFFGTDSRDTDNMSAGRSDSIIIASINPKDKSLKLISIPRDTYVTVSGYGKTKINHAYAYGGEQLSIKTINENFGLAITEYVTIDFVGLINVINDVGGIEMNINDEEMAYINNGCFESYKMTGNPVSKLTTSGLVTLSGEQALTHSRNRTIGNDFTRANRQRDVLVALFNKMSKMDKTKILSFVDSFLSEVKTNINITSYLGLLTSVISNKNSYLGNITSAQIPSADYASGQMIGGVYYYVSDLNIAKDNFIKYIYGKVN